MVNTHGLDRRERDEWIIGRGEALYLDDHFGPAVELFERALDGTDPLGPGQRDHAEVAAADGHPDTC